MSLITIQTVNGAQPVQSVLSAEVVQPNTPYLAKELALAKDLNLGAYEYNIRNRVNPKLMDDVAATQFMDFIHALATNPRADIIFDVANFNLTSDVDYCIQKFEMEKTGASILVGFESIDEFPELPDGPSYIPIANGMLARVAGKNVKIVWNNGLIYRSSGHSQARIKALASLPVHPANQYTQLEDRFKCGPDNAANLVGIKNYFNVTLPSEWLDPANPNGLAARLPGYQIFNNQCHWENYDTVKYITGKPLSAYCAGRMAILTLKNTGKIVRTSIMSNQTLIDGSVANPWYWDWKRVSPFYRFDNSLQVTFTNPALVGNAFSRAELNPDGSRDYGMLVTNDSDTEITIATKDLTLAGGGKLTGVIWRDSGYGARGWDSDTTNEISSNDTLFVLRRNSATGFYFTGKRV